MDAKLSDLLRELKPALISLTVFYVFAFYPLAIYFWSQADYHFVYYIFMGAIGFVSSWLLHNVLEEYITERRSMITEIMALFNILNIIICLVFIAFPLRFYYGSSKIFLSIFKDITNFVYVGPDILRAATIFILISNLLFFLKLLSDKPAENQEQISSINKQEVNQQNY